MLKRTENRAGLTAPQVPRIAAPDGAGQGATEHVSERTSGCLSERAEVATPARAVPRRAELTA